MWKMTSRREARPDPVLVRPQEPARPRRLGLRRIVIQARQTMARDRRGARQRVETSRDAAADTLLTLVSAIRPTAAFKAARRRRILKLAGGSGLAVTAALGAGVAIGFMLSQQLAKRAAQKAQADASNPQPLSQVVQGNGVTSGVDF